jgi:hypothetical protein
MSFLHHLDACNAHDLAHFRPFLVAGQRVGWVKTAFAAKLSAFPDVFQVDNDEVRLSEHLASPEERTAALRRVIDGLRRARRPSARTRTTPSPPAGAGSRCC